jgi:hypothetical protein
MQQTKSINTTAYELFEDFHAEVCHHLGIFNRQHIFYHPKGNHYDNGKH